MAYARSSRIFEMDPERPAWVQKTAFLQEEKSAYPPSAIAVVSPWLRACVELFLEVQKKILCFLSAYEDVLSSAYVSEACTRSAAAARVCYSLL